MSDSAIETIVGGISFLAFLALIALKLWLDHKEALKELDRTRSNKN